MEVLYPRCAGLDVHKDLVVACVRLAQPDGTTRREVADFGTTTRELTRLGDWLAAPRCTHAAMESTGVYWRPVWHALAERLELVLVNARHFRNVPGRKTDVRDAAWLADLLACGLLRGSFVPGPAQQELRALTRLRKQLVRERVQHVQRIQKTLETANVTLASVVSDVVGTTGRAVLEALIAGETDPAQLLRPKHPRIQASDTAFVEALRGRVTAEHRFTLRLHLGLIDTLDRALADLAQRLEGLLEPFRDAVARLVTVPGIGPTVAEALVAEIGTDMARFPTAAHLRSWATLCPRADVRAGKHRSTRLRPGGTSLTPVLVQAAWSAIRVKDRYLRAQFLRLRARRGAKKAIVAVAASLLTIAYHLLRRPGTTYQDLGADHFERVEKPRVVQRHVRRLRELGYRVELAPAA